MAALTVRSRLKAAVNHPHTDTSADNEFVQLMMQK